MGLPAILKNMNFFNDGASYVGQVSEVTRPKLSRKFEGYRGAGMEGEIGIDMGFDGMLELEWKAPGHITEIYTGFGAATHDASLLRWVGAYQDDGTGEYVAVEMVARGRHQEIDSGNDKSGEKGETTVKTVCSYYKLSVNGTDVVEIDLPNLVFIVDGNDRNADLRAALGL